MVANTPLIPTITLSTVHALQNKMNELTALVRFDGDFRRSNMMCFTETWLSEHIDNILAPGFTTVRAERDCDKAQKSVGGGVCVFVSDNWATQYCVRERVCTRDFELLTVSFRPFYLPRKFGQIPVILVYVPGPDFKTAAQRITECFNEAVSGRLTSLFIFWVTLIPVRLNHGPIFIYRSIAEQNIRPVQWKHQERLLT